MWIIITSVFLMKVLKIKLNCNTSEFLMLLSCILLKFLNLFLQNIVYFSDIITYKIVDSVVRII